MVNVSKIKEGIVIDHIRAGHGYKIFQQLGLDRLEDVVVLMRNVDSEKMGHKDLIKIESNLDLNLDGRLSVLVPLEVEESGGDFETTPKTIPGLIDPSARSEGNLKAPERPGAYRLFLYVLDGHGHAAHVNLPFHVDP